MQDFRLKVFRTVAEKLNFTSATEALFLTRHAVTLQIKTREEELGVKLFDRSGSRMRRTSAGGILLEHAERIGDLYIEAETAAALSFISALRALKRPRKPFIVFQAAICLNKFLNQKVESLNGLRR